MSEHQDGIRIGCHTRLGIHGIECRIGLVGRKTVGQKQLNFGDKNIQVFLIIVLTQFSQPDV